MRNQSGARCKVGPRYDAYRQADRSERVEVTQQHRDEFNSRGFTVFEDVVDDATLSMLREECAYFLGYMDASMDTRGKETLGITHRGKRYFISNLYRESRRLPGFLYGSLMESVTRGLLGDTVYLFNEQWVVKGPEQGMKFAWHQDSGYVNFRDPGNPHAPYLTCWIALDDMTEANGTIFVLPHEVAGTRQNVLDHFVEEGTNDLVGYTGDEPGVRIDVKAGSIAAFSSTSLHRSTANTTANSRRAYLAQYSLEPIVGQTGELWGMAVPFVQGGANVYDPATDDDRYVAKRRQR